MRRPSRSLLATWAVTLLVSGLVVAAGRSSEATPGHGDTQRAELGRGSHSVDSAVKLRTGEETVVYTATLAPGATSGWHRHPGAIVVLVRSGTLTSYGLDGEACVGKDIAPGAAYYEDDAASAKYPHFVRNKADVPQELVIVAFNVPKGGSPRLDAEAPAECPEPE